MLTALIRAGHSFWSTVLSTDTSDRLANVRRIASEAEARRKVADYNTGSISEDEAFMLMALADELEARVIIEVGTFIGKSTMALASGSSVEAVYTCDCSNDCLPSHGVVRTYPKQSSTAMLRDLLARDVRADLCFFDGVLSDQDFKLLGRMTHPATVYAFHDYNYGQKPRTKGGRTYTETVPRKGVGNVRLLAPRLAGHVLVEPIEGTTLALLVPEGR